LETEVDRRMGANPVSSSRITTLATIATTTKSAKRLMIDCVWRIAKGAFTWTLPRLPIWIWSIVTEPKVRRKKMALPTQKTGLRVW
jgi:hypothetical protein